jgi:hypothetical protein
MRGLATSSTAIFLLLAIIFCSFSLYTLVLDAAPNVGDQFIYNRLAIINILVFLLVVVLIFGKQRRTDEMRG